MFGSETVFDGQDESLEINSHATARFVKRKRRNAEEDEAAAMEVDDEGEFSNGVLGKNMAGLEETEKGFGGGVERDVLGVSEWRWVELVGAGGNGVCGRYGGESGEAGERAIWVGDNVEDFVEVGGGGGGVVW